MAPNEALLFKRFGVFSILSMTGKAAILTHSFSEVDFISSLFSSLAGPCLLTRGFWSCDEALLLTRASRNPSRKPLGRPAGVCCALMCDQIFFGLSRTHSGRLKIQNGPSIFACRVE